MSYRGRLRAELATFTVTNDDVSTNYYTQFSERTNNITGCSVSTNTITLPQGQYLARAVIGGTRSNQNDILNYRLELDGTLIGSNGGLDSNHKTKVDDTKAQFNITSSQGILKLKVIEESSSSDWTIEPDYSYVIIIRSFWYDLF